MGANSAIEWTQHTFNPWIGCSKVHKGCAHCYAERDFAKRRKRVEWGPHGTRKRTTDEYWRQPLKWNRAAEAAGIRARVFCASLADVFEDWQGPILDAQGEPLVMRRTPDGAIRAEANRGVNMDDCRRDLFALIDATPWLDWLLLTKRPENVRRMWPIKAGRFDAISGGQANVAAWFRENVWLGTSISLQEHADQQIPELVACRDLAPVLFVSAEPLLGPVDLRHVQWERTAEIDCLAGTHGVHRPHGGTGPTIDWLIVGGESGPGARPCEVAWVRDLRDQCAEAGVPCFVKQLGSHCLNTVNTEDGPVSSRVRLRDGKGGDWDEWPEDLRVREFPSVEAVRNADE